MRKHSWMTANVKQGAPSRSSTPQLHERPSTKQSVRRLSAAPTFTDSLDGSSFASRRPQTSMTQRPDTSMSVRTTATTATNAPLVVKKVRATGTSKKDAPKAPRAKKAAAGAASNGAKPTSPTRPQVNKDKGGDDLNNITSGVKKITLITNKQKEARARDNNQKLTGTAKGQAANGSLGSSLPITTNQEVTPREAIMTTNGDYALKADPGNPLGISHQEVPITHVSGTTGGDTASIKTPIGSSPPTETYTTEGFVHYQPNGGEPEALTRQGPLTWLPVNTSMTPSPVEQAASVPLMRDGQATATTASTSSPINRAAATPSPMRRDDLPVFTPTSQLKFAPRSSAGKSSTSSTPPRAKQEAERRLGDAVWEVPETPQ